MGRYNFSAGPSMLPSSVLMQARDELVDWKSSGVSVLEMSHRGAAFQTILHAAISDLKQLLEIPDTHQVLFMQGGAQTQFAAVPLNLLGERGIADYVNSGYWSTLALAEARRYGDVREAASSAEQGFNRIPAQQQWKVDPKAAYLHYTSNETANGVEFHFTPCSEVPLVADMSSNMLSRTIEFSKYGLIYAGAQKNMGIAGLTVVIVRRDLLGQADDKTPVTLNYGAYAAGGSLYNTPTTYAIYIAGLMFRWLQAQGGIVAIERLNQKKAALLYRCLEEHQAFYEAPVEEAARSRMNVVFKIRNSALEDVFLSESQAAGLMNLKGHARVGGLRASLYNAMPLEGVQALVSFMRGFASRYG